VDHGRRVAALVEAFGREFGRAPQGLAEAPGRVNLIGEHVDYNDGLVLPCAIDRSVIVAWARRDDAEVRAFSLDFGEHTRFALEDVTHASAGSWANYVRGVAAVLGGAAPLRGADLALAGDVPRGAGLSSSAAAEVAVAGALCAASGVELAPAGVALLCRRAENEFVGVQSGIMDQFAAALSRPEHALLIDCRTLEHRAVPLRLEAAGLALVVADSGVGRELVSSAYNERLRECADAVAELRELLGRPDLASLRDVGEDDVRAAIEHGGETAALRRARHVAGEIARVERAAAALERDDFAAIGALMAASHASLRDDYDVSSPELDLLVGLAAEREYVAGSRLTGAGFGGCTVNLVRADRLDDFEREVVATYAGRTGRAARAFVVRPSGGLRTWRG
jgi:galactokinase